MQACLLLVFLTFGLVAVHVPMAGFAHTDIMDRMFGFTAKEGSMVSLAVAAECVVMSAVLTPLAGGICTFVGWA